MRKTVRLKSLISRSKGQWAGIILHNNLASLGLRTSIDSSLGRREHPTLADIPVLAECRGRLNPPARTMTPEKQERLQACLQELAALLYEETKPRELQNLESIEKTVRQQMLEHVSPQIALFLSRKQQELQQVKPER